MSSNIVNQVAFLRTSRSFPIIPEELSLELSKSFIETSNAINDRIIGIFPTNRPAITGESWFLLNNRKQQSFRKVFTFTSTTNFNHEIDFNELDYFSSIYGTFTNGTDWFGLIAQTSTAIAGQIGFYITSSQISFVTGGGAPSLTKGIIVLEWLSFP
jgi:hypothetical protein